MKGKKVYLLGYSRLTNGIQLCRFVKDVYADKEDAVRALYQDYETYMENYTTKGRYDEDNEQWTCEYGDNEVAEWITEKEVK